MTNDKFECLFSEAFGSEDTYYIKMKDVEQNSTGDKYATCYIDDGHFKMRVFGKEQRSPDEALRKELDINKELHIDNYTIPIGNFAEPFITCTFITDGLLFVNLFHTKLLTHFHFLYEVKVNRVYGVTKVELGCTRKNFPVKCFFNDEENVIYSFYRQGHSFTIPVEAKDEGRSSLLPDVRTSSPSKIDKKDVEQSLDLKGYLWEDITDKELG